MALGITITPIRPSQGMFKGRKVKAVRFAGDNAKPTGGYVVKSSDLNLRLIEGCIIGQQWDNNLYWGMAIDSTMSSTASTNQATLQVFSTTGSGGGASASATIVSTAYVTALVYGF
jgi:hypothetical protein